MADLSTTKAFDHRANAKTLFDSSGLEHCASETAAAAFSRDALDTFAALFLAKKAHLVQTATKIVGCRCLAEDVVQDTFVKLCEAGIPDDVRAPLAYLFRMVRNMAIDCARRRALEQRHSAPEEQGCDVAASCPRADAMLEGREALDIVVCAMNELPERTRRAFALHRIGGVSQRDIASSMSVSPTLVNFMIRDAHKHCRERLEQYETHGEAPPAGQMCPGMAAKRLAGAAFLPSPTMERGMKSAAGRQLPRGLATR